VAILAIATAFCGCGDKEEEMILLDEISDPSPTSQPEPETVSNIKTGSVTVYVCGAVNAPGVYELPAGSRMVDAADAAGGLRDDAGAEYINLAAKLSDGRKVYFPTAAEVEEALEAGDDTYSTEVNITTNTIDPTESNSENGSAATTDMVDINSASKETLMTLPGIGQSKADKIIAYREQNGGFSSIEDLMLVGGIKEGLFNKVKDKICVR